MKKDKTGTGKSIAPNQKSSRKSNEPKNGAGKRRAGLNPIELGWFSEELRISEEDRPEFEALRDSLSQKYAPTTFMRQIVHDFILCCAWRYKLELRKVSRIVALQETSQKEPKAEAGRDTILMEQWYGADYRTLQDGLRLLRHLRAVVESRGLLHLEQDGSLKDSVIKGFGNQFYDCLMEWKGMSARAIQLAEHMEAMITTFNMKPPSSDFLGDCCKHWATMRETPNPSGSEDFEPPKVVPDPKLQWQMAVKLIDGEIEHLETLDRIRRQDSRETPHARSEASPRRSLADASRDLQLAIDLFLKLEEKGL